MSLIVSSVRMKDVCAMTLCCWDISRFMLPSSLKSSSPRKSFWNVRNHLPNKTVSHCRRAKSSTKSCENFTYHKRFHIYLLPLCFTHIQWLLWTFFCMFQYSCKSLRSKIIFHKPVKMECTVATVTSGIKMISKYHNMTCVIHALINCFKVFCLNEVCWLNLCFCMNCIRHTAALPMKSVVSCTKHSLWLQEVFNHSTSNMHT